MKEILEFFGRFIFAAFITIKLAQFVFLMFEPSPPPRELTEYEIEEGKRQRRFNELWREIAYYHRAIQDGGERYQWDSGPRDREPLINDAIRLTGVLNTAYTEQALDDALCIAAEIDKWKQEREEYIAALRNALPVPNEAQVLRKERFLRNCDRGAA
jgi:hypothetical protein